MFQNLAVQQLTETSDKMLVAPLRFKSVLLEEMDHVISAARMGRPAAMILKNNSISDRDIILKLQEASCAGVRIDMIVRGICCVRAGVPGKTENLHIRSLVGRYLEHGRIYSFFDGVHTRIYIASGDFLTRNTECRVEVGVRVEDPVLVQKLTDILQLQLRDNVNAREMRPDGSYQKVKPAEGEELVNGQMGMYDLLKDDWTQPEPWKSTTLAPEPEAPAPGPAAAPVGTEAAPAAEEQLKPEKAAAPAMNAAAPQNEPGKAPVPAEEPAPESPDHFDQLEQMVNNKPRPAQPAPKAEAPAPRPVKPVAETHAPKNPLKRILDFFKFRKKNIPRPGRASALPGLFACPPAYSGLQRKGESVCGQSEADEPGSSQNGENMGREQGFLGRRSRCCCSASRPCCRCGRRQSGRHSASR